jgi:hypothetical protein
VRARVADSPPSLRVHLSCRFGVTKGVRLNPLTDAKEYSTNDEFKMSFSFSGDRLLVPWITITDGKAHFVQAIDFYFQYSQGFVTHVKWKATCQSTQTICCSRPQLVRSLAPTSLPRTSFHAERIQCDCDGSTIRPIGE